MATKSPCGALILKLMEYSDCSESSLQCSFSHGHNLLIFFSNSIFTLFFPKFVDFY